MVLLSQCLPQGNPWTGRSTSCGSVGAAGRHRGLSVIRTSCAGPVRKKQDSLSLGTEKGRKTGPQWHQPVKGIEISCGIQCLLNRFYVV